MFRDLQKKASLELVFHEYTSKTRDHGISKEGLSKPY